MTSIDANQVQCESAPAWEGATHDATLFDAIVRAASKLPFDSRPGSLQRQCTIGLFVAALSDRLSLSFPKSAQALHDVVFGPAIGETSIGPREPLC
jgi:hypothetical protein